MCCDLWGHDVNVSGLWGVYRIIPRYAGYAEMCEDVRNYDVNVS